MQLRHNRATKSLSIGAAGLVATMHLASAGPAAASDEHAEPESHSADAETNEGTESHPHHRHHVSTFLGGGFRPHEGETEKGFVLGLDYQYRFTSWLSAGGLVEVATGDLREVVFIAPITVKPWRGLNFVAGPGAEIRRNEPTEFLFRLGAIYLFDVDRFTVGPELSFDFVDGEVTYVTGLVFGVGF